MTAPAQPALLDTPAAVPLTRQAMIAELVLIGQQRGLASGAVSKICQDYIIRRQEPSFSAAKAALDKLQPHKREDDRLLTFLREDARRIGEDAGVAWATVVSDILPQCGDPNAACETPVTRQLYLDNVAKAVRELVTARILAKENAMDESERLKTHAAKYSAVTDYLRTQWERLDITSNPAKCEQHIKNVIGSTTLPEYLATRQADWVIGEFKDYFDAEVALGALATIGDKLESVTAKNAPEAPTSGANDDEVIDVPVIEENSASAPPSPENGQPHKFTNDEVKAYRDEADKLIRATYPGQFLQPVDVGKYHNEIQGCEGNLPALKKFGSHEAAIANLKAGLAERNPAPAPEQKALTIVEKPTAVMERPTWNMPTADQWNLMNNLAKSVAASGFYPAVNTYEKAIVIMMKGFSLGLDPMSALDGIDVIEYKGKNTIFYRAKLLKALVHKTGKCQRFDVVATETRAVATVQRIGGSVNTYEYTIEEATTARLVDRPAWQQNPKKMLTWRAVHNACSVEFPEVTFVLSDDDNEMGEAA